MLRSDFDNHALWGVLDSIDEQLALIVEDHQPQELASVERIKTQMAYVRGFDVVASTRAAFFHPAMLESVLAVWTQVSSYLGTRTGNGIGYETYLVQAADHAETGLLSMAAWPRPYGKGGEVKQMDTLFEKLLEAQRTSIDALAGEHASLRAEITNHTDAIEAKRDEVAAELAGAQNSLAALESTVEAQKTEVSDAVAQAQETADGLVEANSAAFSAWTAEREEAFKDDFSELHSAITDRLKAANEEYDELISAKQKYTKLVSAIAADEVASQFEVEARWGRRTGTWFYILGFVLLVVAAVPLVWALFEGIKTTDGSVNWSAIIVRLAIGVLAGSAATVAIRLGGRLINNGNAIKRMELELRAIGPFLANVTEKPKVDDAFIDLVTKAFGNTYADTNSTGGKDSQDDNIPVTSVAQILDLVQKVGRVSPPTS